MKKTKMDNARRVFLTFVILSIGASPACSIRDQVVDLRADGESVKAAIVRDLGVTAHVGMRIEGASAGSGVLVSVKMDEIPVMDARTLKEKVDAIVRRSFKRPVARVDLVL